MVQEEPLELYSRHQNSLAKRILLGDFTADITPNTALFMLSTKETFSFKKLFTCEKLGNHFKSVLADTPTEKTSPSNCCFFTLHRVAIETVNCIDKCLFTVSSRVKFSLSSSVADPLHFGSDLDLDPDPRIRTSD